MPSVRVGSDQPIPKCKECGNKNAKSIGMNATRTKRRYGSYCKACRKKHKQPHATS